MNDRTARARQARITDAGPFKTGNARRHLRHEDGSDASNAWSTLRDNRATFPPAFCCWPGNMGGERLATDKRQLGYTR
jgi:hypothetical protein